jgi:hypothetical protein
MEARSAAGYVLFFTLIWLHDATRPLVWTHGADAVFWVQLGQLAVFGTLAVVAFVPLHRLTRRPRIAGRRLPAHP